jgi:hypothetical protein
MLGSICNYKNKRHWISNGGDMIYGTGEALILSGRWSRATADNFRWLLYQESFAQVTHLDVTQISSKYTLDKEFISRIPAHVTTFEFGFRINQCPYMGYDEYHLKYEDGYADGYPDRNGELQTLIDYNIPDPADFPASITELVIHDLPDRRNEGVFKEFLHFLKMLSPHIKEVNIVRRSSLSRSYPLPPADSFIQNEILDALPLTVDKCEYIGLAKNCRIVSTNQSHFFERPKADIPRSNIYIPGMFLALMHQATFSDFKKLPLDMERAILDFFKGGIGWVIKDSKSVDITELVKQIKRDHSSMLFISQKRESIAVSQENAEPRPSSLR